jgi:hypothetical protein
MAPGMEVTLKLRPVSRADGRARDGCANDSSSGHMVADEKDDDMFTPLIPIKIDSIYGGPLPDRMAKCTPDMYAAIFQLKQQLRSVGADLVLSDLYRSHAMQLQAHADYVARKKRAYSPPPGGSMHEAGRAFDLDLKFIRKMTLPKFWPLAAAHGLSPILNTPDIRLHEAWHFDCRGSHQRVYDYYDAGLGDNFKKPYAAMAASAILSIGQKVDGLGDDVLPGYIQSGLIRLGQVIGDLDGALGPKARAGVSAMGIDPDLSMEAIADAIDKRLQEAFPEEFFIPGPYLATTDAPSHLVLNLDAAAAQLGSAGSALTMYRPDPASITHLGAIANQLQQASVISRAFRHPPKLLARLPTGELYFDSNLELDTDGWPLGGTYGDPYWQPDTSLRYADHGSINANGVPYFVLPLPTSWATQFGIALGDYAAVIYKQYLAFAVFADWGPKNKLGEGSIELLRRLGQERIKPNGRVTNSGMGPGVITIVFPGSGAAADRDDQATLLAAIGQKGSALFKALQGNARLDAA